MELVAQLHEHFGFDRFRPSQEEVCRALVGGEDVLLVMPTGAGKSLCYQLPGLLLKGTTLVISPLLALIDDQVASLKSRGLRAEAIHSGVDCERAREICREYLRGELQFLFIAPERLALSGFLELLARRKPSLVAVDEAHCISQWGHDFRPEYRRLGHRIATLRPAPLIALTATATPRVQDDILGQLGIPGGRRVIQGFRRENIAIEAHEVSKGARATALLEILSEDGRLPAIVYAPARKTAEELAEALSSRFRAEAYHAGMPSDQREATQTRFLSSESDVIVATIAFGMGIDKANVRTVVHAGLPGSVEGYYQEIGRAGRDGEMSRAVLLHSYADLRMHEFFFERDYPEPKELMRVYRALPAEPRPMSWLAEELKGKIEPEVFERAIEKLWAQGGALVDPDENVTRGTAEWERPYFEQREHKKTALKRMTAFAEATGCRMLFFLKHFGDKVDAQDPCGICDRCRPAERNATFAARRRLDPVELRRVALIMASLAGSASIAAGRLFEQAQKDDGDIKRSEFERLLRVLADAHWISVKEESFEKDGKQIAFRKIRQTQKGADASNDDLAALEVVEGAPSGAKKKSKAAVAATVLAAWDPDCDEAFEKLREWRKKEAREQGVPAFRVLSDRVLKAMVVARPKSSSELLRVHGMGPKLCEKYGRELLGLLGG